MTKRINKWNVILAGVAGCMLSTAGVALADTETADSTTNSATGKTRTQLMHTTATVTDIDRSARTATIKTADGESTTVDVPQSVKEFDTLKKGDKVDIDYYRSIGVSMAPSGSKPSMTMSSGADVDVGGGLKGHKMTINAKVVSVDPDANTVTFKGPKGNETTIDVQDPALQAKLPSLKPGQVVRFDYVEAVAAAIRPASK